MIDPLDKPDEPPRRRRRWILIIGILLLIGLAVGEWVASRTVAAKLRGLVADKLDAELKLGTLIYIPPYGAWVSSAELVRDGHSLVSVGRVKLNLAQSPLGDGPIIIASLSADQPVVDLRPRAFDQIAKPTTEPKPREPRKLSGMLQLKKLRIIDGRIRYTAERTGANPPTEWSGLTLDIDTVQQSVSQYVYRLSSRAFPLAEAASSGTIDVDTGQLDVQTLALKGRAEPEPARTPLPAPVQAFIRKYRITGGLAVNGQASVPLSEAEKSSFTLSVAVRDATAELVEGGGLLDHARASFVVQKPAGGGPVTVRMDRVDVGTPGKSLLIDTGRFEMDPLAKTWKLADVRGRLAFVRPAGMTVDSKPVGRAAAVELPPAIAATTQPKGIAKLDRFLPAGRGDFTATASGPIALSGKKWWEAVQHEVILYPRRASFRPKGFVRSIEEIDGGEVRLTNGTIVFQELSGRYADDRLRLRAARIPLDGMPRFTRWQEISGSVTFNPPMRRYSPKLDKILDALNPRGTFLIAGTWNFDKLAEKPKKHAYDLIISSDTGLFALTPREIEVSNMRGDATVTPTGVDVHAVEAEVLGGKLQVTGRYLRNPDGIHATYDGEAHLQNVDIAKLEGNLRDEPPEKPLTGKIFAEAVFQGALIKGAKARENLNALGAQGEIEVVDGQLFKIPVIKQISGNVKELKEAGTIGSAAATFQIDQGIARLDDVAISSPVVGLQGGGRVWFDGTLDLEAVAAPLADWRDRLKGTKIPIVSDVVGEAAGGLQKLLNSATGALLYQFRVDGTIKDVKVSAVPTPVLSDAAAYVFEKMLQPSKGDARPRDLLRPREPRASRK